MCGIIGYVGEKLAAPVLAEGLKRLEYRGYDSAGVATIDTRICSRKVVGRVADLDFDNLPGSTGIAHTRWATHGGVHEQNAHPHLSCNKDIAVVHNGIIENFRELKESLEADGHAFSSETDSEVVAHLLGKYYDGDIKSALLRTVRELQGSFAFLCLFQDKPGHVGGARQGSPLAVGVGTHEHFLASDVLAFLQHTDQVIFLNNRQIAVAEPDRLELYGFDGHRASENATRVAWEIGDISKRDYAHFTLKEIHEQSETISKAGTGKIDQFRDTITSSPKLFITACGTSYHAGLIAKHLLARLERVSSEAVLASEFREVRDLLVPGAAVMAISQSGETADLLDAVREAKTRGAKILSIVNAPGSSLARESDLSIFVNCGPEIGVAATKSFTGQLAVLYKLLVGHLPDLGQILHAEDRVAQIAEKYKDSPDFYFVGRSLHYPVALEGALKLKELSYVHAEGMPAGELKHGTLALISPGVPAVVINPFDDTYGDTLSNAEEMKARGAKIIGVSNRSSPVYDEHIPIPEVEELFYPIVEVVPLQLLAYYVSMKKGVNPDFPRNLAKSVTVR